MRRVIALLFLAGVLAVFIATGTARSQTPPPPPPPPGGPTSSPTATVTPLPTATATPVPLTVAITFAHGTVAPRGKQKVTVTTLPGASVTVNVKFPNGDRKTKSGTADTAGLYKWTYVQPGSRITHSSRKAQVSVTVSNTTGSQTAAKKYTIGYARLDISFQPRKVKRGNATIVWLHTAGTTGVQLVVRYHNGLSATLYAGAFSGWNAVRLAVPATAGKGRAGVTGYNLNPAYPGSASSSFRVK